jgi:hypothetical protein
MAIEITHTSNPANLGAYTAAGQHAITGAEATANKDVANGYAGLDGNARVPVAVLDQVVPVLDASGKIPNSYYGDGVINVAAPALSLVTSASANTMNTNSTEKSTTATVYTKVKEFLLASDMQGVRIKFDLKTASTGAATAYGRIYKSDVAIGTEQTDTTCAYVTKSEDLTTFAAGSKVQVYAKTSDAAQAAYVQNLQLCYDIAIDTSAYGAMANDPTVTSPTLQDSYTDDDDDFVLYGAAWRGQTFTPSTSFYATSVKLKMYAAGSPGTVTVSIRNTSGGVATGVDLCSGTTNGDTLTASTAGELREVAMSPTSITLSAGTMYAICARAPAGDASNKLGLRQKYVGADAGGTRIDSGDSGASWTTDTMDLVFYIYGTATAGGGGGGAYKLMACLDGAMPSGSGPTLAKLDYIFWEGFRANSDGTVDIDPSDPAGSAYLNDAISQVHVAGKKIFLTVYGTAGELTGDAATLATTMHTHVDAYGADGVMIDLEGGYTSECLDSLINNLYATLHPHGHELSIWTSFRNATYTDFECSVSAFNNLDFMLLATYDMWGIGNGHSFPYHSMVDDWETVIDDYKANGYDASKLCPGEPCFARDTSSLWEHWHDVVDLLPTADTQDADDSVTIATFNGSTISGGVMWWGGLDLVDTKMALVKSEGCLGAYVYELRTDKLTDDASGKSKIGRMWTALQ